MCCSVLGRREAGNGLKCPVKVICAHADTAGQLFQRRYIFRFLNQPANFSDLLCGLFGQSRFVGLTSLARAEARFFSVFTCQMELDILRSCRTSCARRTAVHPRRLHRIVELAVGGGIPADECSPARVIRRRACKFFDGQSLDRKSTRLNSSHRSLSRMPSSA